ncbi:putative nucleoporin autopeptidase [Lyophyllum shimeji]|uniref:Nucleoporin autopeptidase n=1 Tax=Lyophyllum shimeji TaxID=47721 RepID=A0A9P3PDY6_LYOSH|nr:putative nucleoporin autopeptidase [Lyophyllum shimeji]
MFGSNVTSSWTNPQQNQQQQQQPTGAFGQPSGFGTSAFGSTGTGAFGQPQQQQPQANPMFGNLGGTTTNAGTPGFGAFGGTNTSQTGTTNPMFGAAKPSTGFGAFGAGGGTFGGGGGAFGQSTNTASGSGTTGLFGQPATTTTSAFGGGTGLFGANKPATGFGATTTTGAAPGAVAAITTGSSNPPYAAHTEKDAGTSNVTLQYQAISCMPAYSNTSHEELRLQDYAQGRKTASTFGTGAFGATQPATTGLFGATSQQGQQPSAFGGTTTNTGFGAFGTPAATTGTTAPASTGIFGGGGAFGQTQQQQQQPQQTTGFGAFGTTPAQQPQQQQTGGLFGGGGTFGSTATKPAFGGFGGGTGTSTFGGGAFGQQNQQQQTQQPAGGGLFGSTTTTAAPAATGFGGFGNTGNKSMFGGTQTSTTQPTTGFGAFGQTQQQQAQQPQGQQTSLFGGGTSLFGGTQQQQQQQPQGAQQPAANPLFGGGQPGGTGLFGGGGGLFGGTQQQQQQPQQPAQQPAQTGGFGGGGLFGAQKQPAAPTGNLFGGFGQQTTTNTQQPSLFGGNLGQTNAQTTTGGGLFGANKTAPLGQSTSTGGGLFGSTTQPTGGVLGASTTAPGAQGTLTASISQPIGADLPIFDMLPPGPRLVTLDSSQEKKKPGFFVDIPTRTPVPRLGYTPATSRLRGFAASTSTTPAGTNPFAASLALTPSKTHPLSLSRVADNKVAGADPFTVARAATPLLGSGARQSVKKVILDKKIEPSELFSKSGSPGAPGKVVFSPKLSVASRERDAQAAQNQTTGVVVESPAPAPRPQRTSNRFTAQPAQQPQGAEGQAAELEDGDYWVKPDLETLKRTGYDELSSFKDLVVGRAGYGEIQFLEPVDLTGLPKLGSLLGDVIRFEEKECSVYPDSDEVDKPPPGSGLNVSARITLLGCWAVDKSTREPIKDEKHPSTIKHVKRLKKIPNTHFESFDIADGKWTFRVDHF